MSIGRGDDATIRIANHRIHLISDFRCAMKRQMNEIVVAETRGRHPDSRRGAVLDVADVAVRQIKRARDEIKSPRLARMEVEFELLRFHEGARGVEIAAF